MTFYYYFFPFILILFFEVLLNFIYKKRDIYISIRHDNVIDLMMIIISGLQNECGWCDASYVIYTRRHLCQRIEHKRCGSIFNQSQRQHPSRTITSYMFHIQFLRNAPANLIIFCTKLLFASTNRV